MNDWAEWYGRVLGFDRFITFDDKDISTEYSALMSIVMSDDSLLDQVSDQRAGAGPEKEPDPGVSRFPPRPRRAAHRAAVTTDICETVTRLRENGVEFLRVPDSYYDRCRRASGEVAESIDQLRPLAMLVDRDQDGYLLQIFTRPVRGSSDAVLRDDPARRAAAGSGRATSGRCSRPSSASRPSGKP